MIYFQNIKLSDFVIESRKIGDNIFIRNKYEHITLNKVS